jgi:sortase A
VRARLPEGMGLKMSKREHHNPNDRPRSILGQLLILIGIFFLGVALSLWVAAPLGSPPSDSAGMSRSTADAIDAPPIASSTPPLMESLSPSTPIPDARPTAPVGARSTITATPTPPASPARAAITSPVFTAAPTLPRATHIAIPSVGIDAKIVDVGTQVVTIAGQTVRQLQVADYAAGHDSQSANPGEGGNIVISGHDDWKGEVFKNLHLAKLGDELLLTTPESTHRYVITEIIYRKDSGASLTDRLAAGRFLAPMPEERVTLVTCWPYGVDTHRLIVVAKPA